MSIFDLCNKVPPDILLYKIKPYIISKCNKCSQLCKKTTFNDYVAFMLKHIFNKEESVFYSMCWGYEIYAISDILFKNGFYPESRFYSTTNSSLLHLYNLQLFITINIKKQAIIKYKDYDTTLENWKIVICVLKNYVKKRFNKIKHNHLTKLKVLNDAFEFLPQNIEQKFKNTFIKVNPKHITPTDCYKNINETHKYITIKADGIYKKGLSIYNTISTNGESSPTFNNDFNNDFNTDSFEYEYVSDHNISYIFNYINTNNNTNYVYSIILKLREYHPCIPNKIYPSLNLDNYSDILNDFNEVEKNAVDIFISKSIKDYKKWWAKYIFKIDTMSHADYLSLLDKITHLNINCYPNDGFILIDNDYNDILKIKPKHLLTIDLLWSNNRFIDNQHHVYNVNVDNIDNVDNVDNVGKLKNKGIYRCYYNELTQCWNHKELRFDKYKPNDTTICKYIENCHKYYWNFSDIKLIDSYYYQNRITKYFKYTEFVNLLKDKTVLDLGCGYNNHTIKSKLYVGIDSDPKIINKFNKFNKFNIYICDFTKEWNNNAQADTYNNIYYHLPNIERFIDTYSNTKFDIIMSNNSIQYLLDNNIDGLFRNINNYANKETLFIVKFLDGDLFNKLLLKGEISCDSSFVKKYGGYSNKIKIYYDWCHLTPIIETLYDKHTLETIFNKYGWGVKEYYYNNIEEYNDLSNWDVYFKCFSNLLFYRK